MQRQNKIKPGAKFGKLTIICFAEWHRDIILICQCECFQIVKISEEELKSRTACLSCEAKKQMSKFRPGDIAIYRNAIGEIAFGEQVIVSRLIRTERISAVEIEYRGRLYKCRPSELESLGVNFYAKRRNRKLGRNEKSS